MKPEHSYLKNNGHILLSGAVLLLISLSAFVVTRIHRHAPDVEYSGINGTCVETASSVDDIDVRVVTDSLIIYVTIGDVETRYHSHTDNKLDDPNGLTYELKDANKKTSMLEIKNKTIVLSFTSSAATTYDTHFKWETQ